METFNICQYLSISYQFHPLHIAWPSTRLGRPTVRTSSYFIHHRMTHSSSAIRYFIRRRKTCSSSVSTNSDRVYRVRPTWVVPNWINFCFQFWLRPAIASIYDQMSLSATTALLLVVDQYRLKYINDQTIASCKRK